MENEITIHHNDQIPYLLCGKRQRIGSNLSRYHNEDIPQADQIDFSKYPFPDPIEPTKSVPTHNIEQAPIQSSRMSTSSSLFYKLRQAQSTINHVSNYLNVYDTNAKRKSLILHQEMEERYLRPLSQKLVQKTTGSSYERFLQKKSRAISAFDQKSQQKDSYSQELPKIPKITYNEADLTDPILKYRKHMENEKRLTMFIQKSTGNYKPPQTFPENDTMNVKKWKTLTETRFFDGQSDSAISKGKKINSAKYHSEIPAQLDFFAPPPTRKQYVRRLNAQECQKDHINFNE